MYIAKANLSLHQTRKNVTLNRHFEGTPHPFRALVSLSLGVLGGFMNRPSVLKAIGGNRSSTTKQFRRQPGPGRFRNFCLKFNFSNYLVVQEPWLLLTFPLALRNRTMGDLSRWQSRFAGLRFAPPEHEKCNQLHFSLPGSAMS